MTSSLDVRHKQRAAQEGVRGQHFTSDQEVKHAVRNWLKMQPADFYKAGIVSLVHRWTVGI